jgi:hypothetical protein
LTRKLLETWISNNLERPFCWGDWDCCTSVASWLHFYDGRDALPAPVDYSDARGAIRYVQEIGGWSALVSLLGNKVSPLMVNIGDVVEIPHGSRCLNQLGVFTGSQIAVAGKEGLASLRLSEAMTAYRLVS